MSPETKKREARTQKILRELLGKHLSGQSNACGKFKIAKRQTTSSITRTNIGCCTRVGLVSSVTHVHVSDSASMSHLTFLSAFPDEGTVRVTRGPAF